KRADMIHALGRVRDPKRQEAALQLLLEPKLDFREFESLLFERHDETTRKTAEGFFRAHAGEIMKRMPLDEENGTIAGVTRLFTHACDRSRRDEIAAFVTEHFSKVPGGERLVAQAIEGMDQCIATRAVVEPELRAWLAGMKLPKPKPAKTK